MGFAHDSDNSNATCSSDRLGLEQGRKFMLVILRKRTDDFY